MDYRDINRRGAIIIIVLLLAIITAFVWWINRKSLNTGNTVPVESHPYHQLAYTKLVYQGGNFVGDVYILDVDSGDITQLTDGGEGGTVAWLDSESLIVYERPRGSLVKHYLLDVNHGTINQTYNINPDFNTVEQSMDGQRLVAPIIHSETSETEGYTVIAVTSEHSQTLLNLWNIVLIPVWLPDNETLVYETNNGEVCLHHVDTNTQDCIAGHQPVLSASISPLLLAYTTEVNSVNQLCIAGIGNRVFTNIDCFDSNEAQFTGLVWRP